MLCNYCTQGVLAFKFPISNINEDPGSTEVSKNLKKSEKFCTSLRFCHKAAEFEKTSKVAKKFQKNFKKISKGNLKEFKTI